MKIRVIKDDFFATKKWFIETVEIDIDGAVIDDGIKWNTVGYKTKKAALAAVESVGLTVENFKWN